MSRHKAKVREVKKLHFKKKKENGSFSIKNMWKDSVKYMQYSEISMPTMRLWGNEGLYVDGYKKVLGYCSKQVDLRLKDMDVVICGSDLMLEYFSKNDVKITGDIAKIVFCSQNNRGK